MAEINRQEAEWNAEIGAYMKAHGVSFDEAFVACGGTIIPDAVPSQEPEDQDWPD